MKSQIKSGDCAPTSEIVLMANFRNKNSDPTAKEQETFQLYRKAIAMHDADPCPETKATVTYSCERWKDAYNQLLHSNFGGAA